MDMISQTDKFEEIIPIFRGYMGYMSQFYDLVNVNAWRDKAVKNLEKFVNQEDCLIYILRKSSVIIGFAMINKHLRFNKLGRAIAEFHIQKDYENQGYGRKLAEYIFSQFPGYWEVAVTRQNNLALMFWKQVISAYTSGEYIEKRKSSINEHGFLFNRETV